MFYQPLVTALQAPLNEQRTKYHPAGVCRMPVIDKLRRVPLLCDAPRNQFRQFYLIFGHRGVAEYSLSILLSENKDKLLSKNRCIIAEVEDLSKT